jgi:hypothetical protein
MVTSVAVMARLRRLRVTRGANSSSLKCDELEARAIQRLEARRDARVRAKRITLIVLDGVRRVDVDVFSLLGPT